jgi:two-component system, chemotaxis family, sensor kinase Cph1
MDIRGAHRQDGASNVHSTIMSIASGPVRSTPGRRAVDRKHRLDVSRLRTSFIAAPTGIALLDGSGVAIDVNPALCALFGCLPAALLDTALPDLVHPDDVASVRALMLASEERPRPVAQLEIRCVRADGQLRWAELSTSHVIGGEDRGKTWIVAHLQDVHARHQADERVQRSEERNAALARELHRRNSELRENNLRLRRFASLASHDLSAPLASVSGVLALIDRRVGGLLESDDRELLAASRVRVEQMRGLIGDMLAYARGWTTLRVDDVDLAEVARAALGGLTEDVQARDPQIHIGALPTVRADREQLLRVLHNLLHNALKFADAGTRPVIHVDARRGDAGWEIAVRDNGPGVAAADRIRIFEMLERAQPRERSGCGLGLAICAEVVTRHGGEIWVEPAPAGGSRFAFTLPDVLPASAHAEPRP